MSALTVATVSPTVQVGDLAGNITRIAGWIGEAVGRGAELIVLPELATSGYVFEDPAEAEALSISQTDPRWAQILAPISDGIVVVVGYSEAADEQLFNSAAVLTADGWLANYRKTHLWGTEKRFFTPGGELGVVVEVPFGRLGVAICYDNEFPEVPRALALAGADVLALPVNWPLVDRPASEHPPELIQAMAAARSSRLPTVIADRHGEERGVVWTGGSAIVDGSGWVSGASAAGLTLARLDLAEMRDKSLPPHNDLFGDRRTDLY